MRKGFLRFPSLVILALFMLSACGPKATAAPSALPASETPVPPTATPALPTETSTPTIEPTPTLGVGSTMIGDDGMTLVYVPEGEFLMGSKDDDPSSQYIEKPQHSVMLDAFWIDETEVTNNQYAACVSAGACGLPWRTRSETKFAFYGDPQFDDYPVNFVEWENANAYCLWAGRRLPTEAEWEKAARGTDARFYPWGNDAPNKSLLNYNGIVSDPVVVKSYPDGVSPYGAYDMAGNLAEWVSDWFDVSYYGNSPSSNPLGPDSGQFRVIKGGDFANGADAVRSAYRGSGSLLRGFRVEGFRCVFSTSR